VIRRQCEDEDLNLHSFRNKRCHALMIASTARVPSPFSGRLQELQLAVSKIGASELRRLPVHRSLDAETTLSAVVKGSIEAELTSLGAEVEEFLAAPPERQSTLTRRLEMFDELRARAGLYEMVLNGNLQGVRQQLNSLTSSVESMLADRAA
jgi:hypothetical protein